MEERLQKQENWWKAKFKEFQDAMMGRLTPASDPLVRVPEPHKDHGHMPEPKPHEDNRYMPELAVRALGSETQPFLADVSTLYTYFHTVDRVF